MTEVTRPSHVRIAALACSILAISSFSVFEAAARSATGAYLAGRHASVEGDSHAAARFYTRALAEDPVNVALQEQVVFHKASAGRIASAAPIARLLVAKNPSHRIGQLILIADEIKRGKFEAAKERIARDGDKAFNRVTRSLLLGWAEFSEGDQDAAQAAFASLDGQDLYSVFGRYHAALAAAAGGAEEEARAAYARALGSNQPSVRLAEAYGGFLESVGDIEGAREIYQSALGGAPGDPIIEAAYRDAGVKPPARQLVVADAIQGSSEALYGLASAFARDDGGIRLSLIYTNIALHLDPENEAAQLLLGNLYETQRRWEDAARAYGKFENDSRYFRSAQIGNAEALSQIDRIDDALVSLQSLEEAFPEDISLPIAIGDLLRRAERYEDALPAYDRAIAALGDDAERYWSIFYARGVSWERTRNWPAAEADLLKALEFQPDQPHVLNYLGYSWIDQGLHLQKAKGMIERAVALRPNDGYITDSLGWAEYRLGEYEKAVDTMARAVELQPTDPIINDHYGDALWMVGRKLEARFQWRRALSFKPEEPGVPERIKRKLADGLDAVLAEEAAEPEMSETPKDDSEANGG